MDVIFCSSAVKEISDLLNTGLDDETLRICVQLLEAGINPEALADVVKELRREVAAIRVSYPIPLPLCLIWGEGGGGIYCAC